MPHGSRRDLLRSATLGIAGGVAFEKLLATQRLLRASVGQESGAKRDAYSLAPDVTYLNHASIGCVPRAVLQALHDYQAICEENPWLYVWGEAWDGSVAETRAQAAHFLGCTARETALTHNTTEAFNHLAHGLPLGTGDEVLFSSLNHDGASRAWEYAAEVHGYSVRTFDFPLDDVEALTRERIVDIHAAELRPATKVLVIPHVDNLVGIRHPLKELAELAKSRGVRYVAVDGAQSAGMFPIDVKAAGIDFFATSGHKWLQSPKGLGIFYVREELIGETRPMWVTWGHDLWRGTARVFEDYGTRDPADVLALGDALAFHEATDATEREEHHRALRTHCRERAADSPALSWSSPGAWEDGAALYSIQLAKGSSEKVAAHLFESGGFVVRPFERGRLNALRVSPDLLNTKDELDRFLDALEAALR